MFDAVFGFILTAFLSCFVTAMFADICGDHIITYIASGCCFGGALIILIAGLALMFV